MPPPTRATVLNSLTRHNRRLIDDNLYFRAVDRDAVAVCFGDPSYRYPYKVSISNNLPEGFTLLGLVLVNADVNFTEYNGKVYFLVPRINVYPSRGLYVTDGTEAGTTLVKNDEVPYSGRLTNVLMVLNDKLYFVVENDDTDTNDLWVSDGTAAVNHCSGKLLRQNQSDIDRCQL